MDISGSYTFPVLPVRVWDALMDPAVVASCIPGCDRFEPQGEDRYRAQLDVALAAMTGRYEGSVVLSDKVPYVSYRLTVEGQGRPGFVSGNAAIVLREEGDSTVVQVDATVQTRGAIARLGQRLIGSVSQMMMDRFFTCLRSKVSSA